MAYASLSGANGLIINNGTSNVATITNAGDATCTGLTVYNKSNNNKIATIDANTGTTIYDKNGINGIARITVDGSFSSSYGGKVGSTTTDTTLRIPIPKNKISLLTLTSGAKDATGLENQTALLLTNIKFNSTTEFTKIVILSNFNQFTITNTTDYINIKIPSNSNTYVFVFSMICLGGPTYNTSTSSFTDGFNNVYKL